MRSRGSLVLALAILIAAALGCAESNRPTNSNANVHPQSNYQVPAEATFDFSIQRNNDGGVIVQGATNLPDGLKVWIDIPDVEWKEPFKDFKGNQRMAPTVPRDSDLVVSQGIVRTKPLFAAKQTAIPPGQHSVHVLAYFNGAWQSKEVRALVGEGGTRLKGKILKKQDPDVVDSDLILDYTVRLEVPPVTIQNTPTPMESNSTAALGLVQKAVLSTPENGKSSMNVGDGVRFMMGPGTGLRENKGWSVRDDGEHYNVIFNFINGAQGEDEAIWSVDKKTKTVRYINKNAKIFSWIPPE